MDIGDGLTCVEPAPGLGDIAGLNRSHEARVVSLPIHSTIVS
jgi:hypothetical protein